MESGREVKVALQEKPRQGRGWGRDTKGWERLKPKPLLRRFSMVQPLPLGESIWLELPWSLDVGQRTSLQLPDLASSCS